MSRESDYFIRVASPFRQSLLGGALACALVLLGQAGCSPRKGQHDKAAEDSLKVAARPVKPGDHRIGHRIPALSGVDLRGVRVPLDESGTNKVRVVALFGSTCPVSKRFGPELARLEKDYAKRGVEFFFVVPIAEESNRDISKFTASHQLISPVLRDVDGSIARELCATTTTEAFVLDAANTLVYRGAVSDQYGLGFSKDAPSRAFLRDALDAVLEQRQPGITATSAPGCALDQPGTRAPASAGKVTYHAHISRIIQHNCTSCHHDGGVAPFSLESYDEVIKNAGMIKKQVARGAMPPWFAAPLEGETESPWANDCSISPQDKQTLLDWLASSDRPAGDPKDAPLPRIHPTDWTIGTPDLILQVPEPIAVKAEGTMPYVNIFLTNQLSEDRWVQAWEVLPSDRSVVHHAALNIMKKGSDKIPDVARSFWAAYLPGNSARTYPPGFAKKLPAGARLHLEMHYTPNGKATKDQTRIGLVFAKSPPTHVVQMHSVRNTKINIPAGAADHVETASQTFKRDVHVLGLMPHAHLRGKSFRFELIQPDGKTETLLDIPRYDFNWQYCYDYAVPRVFPRGSTLRLTAVYDNSTANPANPDASQPVKWGLQSHEEMLIGYFQHFVPADSPEAAND